ncbi:hypothetical protein PVT71_18915 [Salipiger sp. H15]|uniref:Uncharacterized protein n=1 Tax=Alloyangia sp. H15 TaxID=3029062 RepID=A0AAU8AKB3_9RHOB
MSLPIPSLPLQSLPTLFGSLSLSQLRASAGPDGASAGVSLASIEVSEAAADPGTGTGTGAAAPRSAGPVLRAAQVGIEARTQAEEGSTDHSLAGARERGLQRIRARMQHMAKALERLQSGVAIRSGASAGAYAQDDAQVTFASYGGNLALSASAGTLSNVATGTGHDALALSAERVEGVYTDVDPQRSAQGGNDAVAIRATEVSRVYTGAGNDAVAIAARTVTGVNTGAGSDAVAILADRVSGIYTDRNPVGRGRAVNGTGNDTGNDTVTLQARQVQSVYTGGGADAVTIAAQSVESIYTGEGDDAVTISAAVVGGIYTGAGRDAVSIEAGAGRSRLSAGPWSTGSPVESRMLAALGNVADIDTGAGDDAITLSVAGAISLEAGQGDDSITLGGGTVALRYAAGDGNDSVSLAPGTEVVVQLGEDIADWSVTQEGDSLLLRIGEGSIRFDGVAASAAIGLVRWGDPQVEILHAQLPLDAVA